MKREGRGRGKEGERTRTGKRKRRNRSGPAREEVRKITKCGDICDVTVLQC